MLVDHRVRSRCEACRRRFIVWLEAGDISYWCVSCANQVGVDRGLFGDRAYLVGRAPVRGATKPPA